MKEKQSLLDSVRLEKSQNPQTNPNLNADSKTNTHDVGDFEELLEKAKITLDKLNSQEITLKETLQLYQEGMDSLKNAQEILESAKLQYQEIKE